jgi:hypothetical protein
MARGLPPVAAIGEAKHRAAAWGFGVIEIIMEGKTGFDFAVHDKGVTSLVRVRRLKYNAYSVGSIQKSCAEQVRQLRELHLPEGIGRELWVRGPERAWHRYRILPETMEEIGEVGHTLLPTCGTGTDGEQGPAGQVQPG